MTVWLLGQLHEGFDAIFGNEVVVAAVPEETGRLFFRRSHKQKPHCQIVLP